MCMMLMQIVGKTSGFVTSSNFPLLVQVFEIHFVVFEYLICYLDIVIIIIIIIIIFNDSSST